MTPPFEEEKTYLKSLYYLLKLLFLNLFFQTTPIIMKQHISRCSTGVSCYGTIYFCVGSILGVENNNYILRCIAILP